MLLPILIVVTLHWTNPGLARSAIPCADSTVRASLVQVNIYRAQVGGTGQPLFLRAHAYTGTTPLTDSVNVENTPPATYWTIPVSVAGRSECTPRGYTVGMAAVGVPFGHLARRELFDLAGRKVSGEPSSGIYFERITLAGRTVKRIVVIH